MKFDNNKLYYFSNLKLSALRDVEIKRMVKLLKILDIINKLLYRAQEDLKSEYNNDIIVVNLLNKSSYRFKQNESLELLNQ